jgi:hypothetical protein
MVGAYHDGQQWTLWRVALLVDKKADPAQQEAREPRNSSVPSMPLRRSGDVCQAR